MSDTMTAVRLYADWDPKPEFKLGSKDVEGKQTYLGSKVWRNPQLKIEDVPVPKAGPGEVLIEVKACGICGSDVHMAQADDDGYIWYPGLTGFRIFEYRQVRFGLMICFDWRFPEAARRLALSGAQIICHPANLVLPHCPDAMVTRALENNVFTVTADRIGSENRTGIPLKFIGRSRIIAPDGIILGELGETETGFISADIDTELADRKRLSSTVCQGWKA